MCCPPTNQHSTGDDNINYNRGMRDAIGGIPPTTEESGCAKYMEGYEFGLVMCCGAVKHSPQEEMRV